MVERDVVERDVVEPDVFNAQCGSREVLGLIADKWSALVLYALMARTRRHSELLRLLDGISQKMLTQTLRRLEDAGLVSRTMYPVVPPHVEYSLTELGESLSPILREVCRWAEGHVLEVQRSHARAGR